MSAVDWSWLLAWRPSATMEASFCVEALEDALAHHVKSKIVNTDQRVQFIGSAFTDLPTQQSIAASMDGKGAWRDNVFVEHLWRTIKHEEVYLRANESVSDARASIGRYLRFYNERRLHASLDGTTPRSGLLLPAALPFGSLIPADAPPIEAEILFR
jgi:putative transposase